MRPDDFLENHMRYKYLNSINYSQVFCLNLSNNIAALFCGVHVRNNFEIIKVEIEIIKCHIIIKFVPYTLMCFKCYHYYVIIIKPRYHTLIYCHVKSKILKRRYIIPKINIKRTFSNPMKKPYFYEVIKLFFLYYYPNLSCTMKRHD